MRWTIDPSHTSADFAVRHMGLSTVRGRFRNVGGTVGVEDGQLTAIEATIDRKDWGLTWNKVLDLGALLVGEEIRLTIDAQAVAPAAGAA